MHKQHSSNKGLTRLHQQVGIWEETTACKYAKVQRMTWERNEPAA